MFSVSDVNRGISIAFGAPIARPRRFLDDQVNAVPKTEAESSRLRDDAAYLHLSSGRQVAQETEEASVQPESESNKAESSDHKAASYGNSSALVGRLLDMTV